MKEEEDTHSEGGGYTVKEEGDTHREGGGGYTQ